MIARGTSLVRIIALLAFAAYAGSVAGGMMDSGGFQWRELNPLIAFLSLLGAFAFLPTCLILLATTGICWLLIRGRKFLLCYPVAFIGCAAASYFGTAHWTVG